MEFSKADVAMRQTILISIYGEDYLIERPLLEALNLI